MLINKPKVCCICGACLLASKAQTKQGVDTAWSVEGPAASKYSQTTPAKEQTECLPAQLTLINQLQLIREIIHYTTLAHHIHKHLPKCSWVPVRRHGYFFKWLPEEIQALSAGERTLVQDMHLLEEGDSSCHSTQIIIMHVLGQREALCGLRGRMNSVVWEWRALLPALISAYGCDYNVKQHIKRQCSEIALDPCLPLHRQAPSPVGSLLSQLQFKSSQNRGVMLVRSLVPPSTESTLITT